MSVATLVRFQISHLKDDITAHMTHFDQVLINCTQIWLHLNDAAGA